MESFDREVIYQIPGMVKPEFHTSNLRDHLTWGGYFTKLVMLIGRLGWRTFSRRRLTDRPWAERHPGVRHAQRQLNIWPAMCLDNFAGVNLNWMNNIMLIAPLSVVRFQCHLNKKSFEDFIAPSRSSSCKIILASLIWFGMPPGEVQEYAVKLCSGFYFK